MNPIISSQQEAKQTTEIKQTAWKNPNIQGRIIDPKNPKKNLPSGFGAMDSIFKHHPTGEKIVDIGGGEHDLNSGYCREKFSKRLSVYDPFMRDEKHNNSILEESQKRGFDSSISTSVLNVIDSKKYRMKHIEQCKKMIKSTGKAFFRVYPGNSSGKEEIIKEGENSRFQSNRNYKSYLEEIQTVFGKGHVTIDEKNEILIAKKFIPFIG